jgi:hypothetical protein
MKFYPIVLMTLVLAACNPFKRDPLPSTPPAPQVTSAVDNILPVAEEDCDDKAKKPIEIKEDSISLSGEAGCTLEE